MVLYYTIHGGKFDVFDCCVGWIALLTIYRAFQHDAFCWTMRNNKSYPLLPDFGRRGTVESVLTSCTRINFDVRSYGCVCQMMIAHGLVYGHPAEKIARPLSAVNGLRTDRTCCAWFIQSFVVVDYSTKSVWPPYSYIPYSSLLLRNAFNCSFPGH
jgi:hypothetical protein